MKTNFNPLTINKSFKNFGNLDIADLTLFALSIFLIVFLCSLSFFGLEFSDEGFYLNWIANPESYKISYTHFGFLFAPLFDLLGNNIAFLRMAGIIITFFCGILLTHTILRKVFLLDQSIKTISLAFTLAVPVFLYYAKYLILTPSYNNSNYMGIMLSLCVTLQLMEAKKESKFILWIALGACGFLVGLSKPTTALLLGPTLIIFLIVFSDVSIRHFAIGAITTFLLFYIFALNVDGSFWDFIRRIRNGVEVITIRDAGYGLSEINLRSFYSGGRALVMPQNILAVVLVFAILLISKTRNLLLNRLILIISILLLGTLLFSTPDLPTFIFYGISIGALLAACLRLYLKNSEFVYPWRWLAFSILLLSLPPIYAFGTNNSLWSAAGVATFFSLLAAMVSSVMHFKAKDRVILLRALSLMFMLYTANYLVISAGNPYRQTIALWSMDTEINLNNGTSLILDKSSARYANTYLQLANKHGFKDGDGIIDLSGRSPTIAFVLSGINLGTPWMNGGYPNSVVSAARALDFVSCEHLNNAWLITEPNGPRSLPVSAFRRHEIYLQDYKLVGTIPVPSHIAGHDLPSTQYFYRPNNQRKLRSCNS